MTLIQFDFFFINWKWNSISFFEKWYHTVCYPCVFLLLHSSWWQSCEEDFFLEEKKRSHKNDTRDILCTLTKAINFILKEFESKYELPCHFKNVLRKFLIGRIYFWKDHLNRHGREVNEQNLEEASNASKSVRQLYLVQ